MDLSNLDLSQFILAGFPILVLVPLLVQIVKELGVPSTYLPAASVGAAMLLIALAIWAPVSVALLVGGGIAVGGAATMGVRFIKAGGSDAS